MKRTLSSLFVLASAMAPFVIAHAAPAEKSEAIAKLAQLPFPMGEMTCTGNMIAFGGMPGHATTASARVEKVLGGNWIVIHYEEAQTDASPRPYSVVQYIGYEDAGKHRFSALSGFIRRPCLLA